MSVKPVKTKKPPDATKTRKNPEHLDDMRRMIAIRTDDAADESSSVMGGNVSVFTWRRLDAIREQVGNLRRLVDDQCRAIIEQLDNL